MIKCYKPKYKTGQDILFFVSDKHHAIWWCKFDSFLSISRNELSGVYSKEGFEGTYFKKVKLPDPGPIEEKYLTATDQPSVDGFEYPELHPVNDVES